MRAANNVGHVFPRTVNRRRVQLAVDQHRRHAFLRWNPLKGNALGRREAGSAAVAQLFSAFHVPVDLVLRNAEIVLEYAALPERGRLLILADADAFTDEIAWLFDAGVYVVRNLGMEKAPARKHRQGDHVEAAFARDQVGRHRHFPDVEFLKFELAPEGLRRMRIGRHDLDALGLDGSVHQWIDPLVERGNETQSQFWHASLLSDWAHDWNRSLRIEGFFSEQFFDSH